MSFSNMIDAVRERSQEVMEQPVSIGLPLAAASMSVLPVSEGLSKAYYSGRLLHRCTLAFYAKAATQREAMDAVDTIGWHWTNERQLPRGDDWAALRMQAQGAVFVDREDSTGLWLYVNNVELLYLKQ